MALVGLLSLWKRHYQYNNILNFLKEKRNNNLQIFGLKNSSRLGGAAVERLLKGESGKMVGLIGNQIKATDIDIVLSHSHAFGNDYDTVCFASLITCP